MYILILLNIILLYRLNDMVIKLELYKLKVVKCYLFFENLIKFLNLITKYHYM